MDHFHYKNRVLHCEDVPVSALAEKYGTPLYVYSKATLMHHLAALRRAFAEVQPLICYSIKTNPNVNICRLMGEDGAGFDVTSAGELYRALKAGGTGPKIVFAGVGKTDAGLVLIDKLRRQGHEIEYLNMGGGFGIHYRKQEALPADAFAEVIVPGVKAAKCKLILEPGRFIVGNAGILLSRVIYTKDSGGKRFVIQDGGMNDLIRPTLYDAFHRIWPAWQSEIGRASCRERV